MNNNFFKITFFTVILLLSLQKGQAQTPPKVGGDKDEHGCISSAGYQWSAIRNECVRIFEIGTALSAKAKNLDQSLACYIIFKSKTERSKIEIFIPKEQKAIILTKNKSKNTFLWKNEAYTLSLLKGVYRLKDSKNTLLYQGK
jgi:hypothetical protein